MSSRIQVALGYLIGILLPIGLGEVWPGPEASRPLAVYLFFLCIACMARFFGFGPAIVCTIASAIMLWNSVLATATAHSSGVQVTRLILFLTAACVVAAVSRQKTREARGAEKRLRALFDRAIDAILFFDETGRYVDANPAASKLFGVAHDEIVGHPMGSFTAPEEKGSVTELRRRLLAEGTLTGEWHVARTDGSVHEVEYRAVASIQPGLHVIIGHDITQRKAAERSLRQLSARLLQLQEEERSRIARQLHETTAQNLAALRLHLVRISRSGAAGDPEVKPALDESIALTEQSITEIRTLSYLLHPPMIEEVGMLASLRWYVRGFEARSGITTTLDAPEHLARLPREIETAVFHMVQEALTNIQRHSGSAVARIAIELLEGHLRVRVADTGKGLPLELRADPVALRSAGVGLAGMEQRARELGGTMSVQSDDNGTRLELTLPTAGT
jgi:two-component system, NarL family, sensor kinase